MSEVLQIIVSIAIILGLYVIIESLTKLNNLATSKEIQELKLLIADLKAKVTTEDEIKEQAAQKILKIEEEV